MSASRSVRLLEGFPLSCADVDRQAVRYFFNGLPKGRRAALDLHLRGCPRCLKKLEVFGRAWAHGASGRRAGPV